jgi:hypothetical protein
MNSAMKGMWKEAAVVKYQVLFENLNGLINGPD